MCKEINKTVIINRAVPGSGKTTISNCIVNYLKSKNIKLTLHSTDEFFMTPAGRYRFHIEKLYDSHQLNLANFIKSLLSGNDVVICDNINIGPWQTTPYTDAARKYGYQIIFITFTPRELEKHIQSQQVTPEKPDAHGVPEDVLLRFIKEYHDYNDLLYNNTRIDPNRHIDYYWDTFSKQRVKKNSSSPCFDTDFIIQIEPHEYQMYKELIGEQIYQCLTG